MKTRGLPPETIALETTENTVFVPYSRNTSRCPAVCKINLPLRTPRRARPEGRPAENSGAGAPELNALRQSAEQS